MSDFQITEYKTLLENFLRAKKRIPFHRDISNNKETLIEQKNDLVLAFNKIVVFSTLNYPNIKEKENKARLVDNIRTNLKLLQKLLNRINFTLNLPKTYNKFHTINDKWITYKMTDLSKSEFLRLSAGQINKNYSGDPLSLKSFVDSLNLLSELATTADLKKLLISFALTKLEGRARETVSETPGSLQDIIKALENKIKPENSKIVEGKLTALRVDRVPLQDFTDKTNELAESLRRALVIEGIPSDKADEMVIEKTVEVCRANARTDLVRSVLASTKFTNFKEVVAKFVIEINTQTQEKQILAYRTHGQNNNNRGKYYNRTNNRGNFNNSSSSRGSYNHRGKSNRGRNNNGYNNGYKNNYYNNNRNSYNNKANSNQSNNQNVYRTENLETPQWELGAPSQNQNLQTQI